MPPQSPTSPAPLSAAAMRKTMGVCSGAMGLVGLLVAAATSDAHPVAVVAGAVFMALFWGLATWWALRGRTRALWQAAPRVDVAFDARVEGMRRGAVRGLALSVVLAVVMAGVLLLMQGVTKQGGLELFWPGFMLGACLWMLLDLRDLNRWQTASGLEVLLRRDVSWLSAEARAGKAFIAAPAFVDLDRAASRRRPVDYLWMKNAWRRTPAEDLLVGGLDDWAYLGWASQSGVLADIGDLAVRREATLVLVSNVLADGLMVAGDVRGGEFIQWTGGPEEWIERIRLDWLNDWGDDIPTPGAVVWLENTPSGDRVGRRVLAREKDGQAP